nr:hypothetical protein TetV2_00285 [Oceanusvirus sp.]
MALFRTTAADGVSIPFVFEAAQSSTAGTLISMSFRNKDRDTNQVYEMANIQVYDAKAAVGEGNVDGFGALAFSTSSNGVIAEGMRLDSTGFLGIGTSNPSAKLDVVGDASFTGSVAVGENMTLQELVAESVVASNLRVPGGLENQLLFNNTSCNLEYIYPHTNFLDKQDSLISSSLYQDAPLFDSLSNAAVFDKFIDVYDNVFVSTPTSLTLPASDLPLLVLAAFVTSRSDGIDQEGRARLQLSGAGQLATAVYTTHTIGNAVNDVATSSVAAFVKTPTGDVLALDTARTNDAGGGAMNVSANTRVSVLRLSKTVDAYHGQSLGLSTVLTASPAVENITDTRLADAPSFVSTATGFAAQQPGAYMIFASANISGSDNHSVSQIEVNGSPAASVDFYNDVSDLNSDTEMPLLVGLSASDTVRLSHANYGGYSATLAGQSLSAARFETADSFQATWTTAPSTGKPFLSGEFARADLDAVGVQGDHCTLSANSVTIDSNGSYLIAGFVSVGEIAGGRDAAIGQLVLNQLYVLASTTKVARAGGRNVTLGFATVVELARGSVLSVEGGATDAGEIFNAGLSLVRLSPMYVGDDVLIRYGGYYKYSLMGISADNISPDYSTVFAFNTGAVPYGTYKIVLTAVLERRSNDNHFYRLLLDNEKQVFEKFGRLNAPNNNQWVQTNVNLVTLEPGEHTFELQIRQSTGLSVTMLGSTSIEFYLVG